MSADFDTAAANRLVADRIQHATREEVKCTLRAIMADPLTKSADYDAVRAKLNLISQEEGYSHTKILSGGVWREQSPRKVSEATLADRRKYREEMSNPLLPTKKYNEVRAKYDATYQPDYENRRRAT